MEYTDIKKEITVDKLIEMSNQEYKNWLKCIKEVHFIEEKQHRTLTEEEWVQVLKTIEGKDAI